MTLPIPALSSARMGIQASLRRLDRAAEAIGRAGLEVEPSPRPRSGNSPDPSEPPGMGEPSQPGSIDLPDAVITMLIAQRAFSANLRVVETADEMAQEIVDLGRRRG